VKLDHQFDSGSGISSLRLSPVQIENLTLLGRVWGFAKYYHPRVVAGRINWDYELFRVLPAVLHAQDRTAATRVISAWLGRVGDPPPCTACEGPPKDAQLRPDLDWIHDRRLLGASLSRHLAAIYGARRTDSAQYYVSFSTGGWPSFRNEARYRRPALPDAGYRLLAVYRLWNIVEYWYPYRDVIGEDWTGVLREFIPLAMAKEDSTAYRLMMLRMITRLHDGHANLWSDLDVRPPRGKGQLPVNARFIGGQAVVVGYSDDETGPATGLRPGDVITAIDGFAVDSLVKAWEPYYAGGNRPAKLRDLGMYLTRGPVGSVHLTVSRQGGAVSLSLERPAMSMIAGKGRFHDRRGPSLQMLSPEVAYLRVANLAVDSVSDEIARASRAKVLVVDLRAYPNEFVVYKLGGHFVTQETPFARFTRGDLADPGTFRWTPAVSLEPIAPHFGGKLVVLVDEDTQSQAEFTAMALQAAGATVVGSTTAGADGDMVYVGLPGGLLTAITGEGVYYPDGRPTQRVGIIPDLEVHPTVQGIRAGRDEVLEAAVSNALGHRFHVPSR
jgi:C-terminal processing protease CtpA/Prc